MKTTSITKANEYQIKGIVSKGKEGWMDITDIPILVEKKGMSLGKFFNELSGMFEAFKVMRDRQLSMKNALEGFVKDNGYKLSGDTWKSLEDDIQNVVVMNPEKKHHVAKLKDGYITEMVEFDLEQMVFGSDIPEDVASGFYKVENGIIVLDKKRKEQALSLD